MPLLWVILHFLAAGVLMALVNAIGLGSWRRSVRAHWTERARLLWPVRATAGLCTFLLPVFFLLLHEYWEPLSGSMMFAVGLAGFLGALLGGYPMQREMFPGLNFQRWVHQVVAVWGILFSVWILFFTAMIFMPAHAGWGMVLVAGGYLGFHVLMQWGLFRWFLRRIKFLRPAAQRLQAIVAGAAARMNVKVRATWQLSGVLANALALPITRELVFTDRLLDVCSDEEIAAICAHELAHLTESKRVLVGRLLGSLVVFPLVFNNPVLQSLGIAGVGGLFLGMWLIQKAARRLSLRMEKRADAMAFQEQAKEGVYARALEQLYRANQMPAVNAKNKQTHPHLYDRLVAAGVAPDYPRPAKPRRMTWVGWVVALACLVVLLAAWVHRG
jgi:Zn-dependent protease with chaperone function